MMAHTTAKNQFPRGEYQDSLRDPTGKVLWQTPWRSNLIVNSFGQLLAALVKGDERGERLMFWAVGTGDASWDNPESDLPSEETRRGFTNLVNETGRKAIEPSQIVFVPDTNSLSDRIEIRVQFTTENISGTSAEDRQLREFGLFAGGKGDPNTGILINHRIHSRIDLEDGFPLVRNLRLTF